MVRAYMAQPIEGTVTFIYPELKTETRTARIRIEVPNPDGRFKVDMYADVMFETGAAPGAPVFVGASGALTQAPPTPPGSAFLLRIGAATAANALHVNPSPPLAF
jgi:multidrug efflux pump subunit AcrA (membrane-fusion protein)